MEKAKRSQQAEQTPSSPAPQPPVVVIIGQTASGKSALAMRAAKAFNGEIICADSRTVYTGIDIGTAKPSTHDRQLVPHHGLDLIKPTESFSAAAFQSYARDTVSAIQSRYALPIIVGGSGLYIDGYIYDFSFAGEANLTIRKKLEEMSIEELQDKARQVRLDETQVSFQNPRHLSRAIERMASKDTTKMQQSRRLKPDNTLLLGIKIEREQLIERINARVDTMFASGLVNEVQNLIKQYGPDAPGLLAAGYHNIMKHLAGEIAEDQAKVLFVRSHKYLAKRQQTWFKRNTDIIWVQSEEEALEKIFKFTQV